MNWVTSRQTSRPLPEIDTVIFYNGLSTKNQEDLIVVAKIPATTYWYHALQTVRKSGNGIISKIHAAVQVRTPAGGAITQIMALYPQTSYESALDHLSSGPRPEKRQNWHYLGPQLHEIGDKFFVTFRAPNSVEMRLRTPLHLQRQRFGPGRQAEEWIKVNLATATGSTLCQILHHELGFPADVRAFIDTSPIPLEPDDFVDIATSLIAGHYSRIIPKSSWDPLDDVSPKTYGPFSKFKMTRPPNFPNPASYRIHFQITRFEQEWADEKVLEEEGLKTTTKEFNPCGADLKSLEFTIRRYLVLPVKRWNFVTKSLCLWDYNDIFNFGLVCLRTNLDIPSDIKNTILGFMVLTTEEIWQHRPSFYQGRRKETPRRVPVKIISRNLVYAKTCSARIPIPEPDFLDPDELSEAEWAQFMDPQSPTEPPNFTVVTAPNHQKQGGVWACIDFETEEPLKLNSAYDISFDQDETETLCDEVIESARSPIWSCFLSREQPHPGGKAQSDPHFPHFYLNSR